MSGTGKSSVLAELSLRGYRTVDTDTDEWSEWVTLGDGSRDWIWRRSAIAALLNESEDRSLFVAGCKTNQGDFYDRFDSVALLSAPVDVLMARVESRTNNPYGSSPSERALIRQHVAEIEPLLRWRATIVIDATLSLSDVADQLEALTRT
jgi:shikimate kinase